MRFYKGISISSIPEQDRPDYYRWLSDCRGMEKDAFDEAMRQFPAAIERFHGELRSMGDPLSAIAAIKLWLDKIENLLKEDRTVASWAAAREREAERRNARPQYPMPKQEWELKIEAAERERLEKLRSDLEKLTD